jgi:NADH-quinone oxidoreductase subunit E
MAWIIKDSANAQIDRRDTPYLTDAIKQHLETKYIPRYADRRGSLLMVCHHVQHEYGYLPYQALEEIATFIGIAFSEVLDTVSFYEEFRLKPAGKYLLQICRSIGCELCGQRDLSAKIQAHLDILPGETTDDGNFTLVELECLGACEKAPAMLINEDLMGPMTWDNLKTKLDELSAK